MSGEVQLNSNINPAYSVKSTGTVVDNNSDSYFSTNGTYNTENTTLYYDSQTLKKEDLTGILKEAADLIPEKEDWSPEELCNVFCVNYILNIADNSQKTLEKQSEKDGLISNFFNNLKEWTGLGTSKSDAVWAIKNQEKTVKILLDEIENGGNFDQKFKELTGFDYNNEAFFDCVENEMYISLINNGSNKIAKLEKDISKCTDFNQAFEVFNEYYNGNEELSLKALNDILHKRQEAYMLYDSEVYVGKDENGNYTILGKGSEEMHKENVMYDAISFYNTEYAANEFSENFKKSLGLTVEDCYKNYALSYAKAFSNLENVQKVQTLENEIDKSKTMEEVLTHISNYYDGDIEKAVQYVNLAFKNNNLDFKISLDENENGENEFVLEENSEKYPLSECQNLLNRIMTENTKKTLIENYEENSTLKSLNAKDVVSDYVKSQEGAIKKGAQALQIGGLVVIIAGGIASIAGFPEAGVPMLSFGQKMAIGGMFGDNVLETIDTATSNKTKEEKLEDYKNITKETFVEGALMASGIGIGKLSAGANAAVAKATGYKALGMLAEVGVDGALSIAADYMITGDFNLKQEGFSQLINVLTGISTAKNMEYKKNKIEAEARNQYLRNIGVEDVNLEAANKLFEMGFGDVSIKYLSALSPSQIERGIQLKNSDFPDFYIADAAALSSAQYARLSELEGLNVSKYYQAQLAALNDDCYAKALELFASTKLNSASILDIVTSNKSEWDSVLGDYLSGKSTKIEINDEVMANLELQAYKLNLTGLENIDIAAELMRDGLGNNSITQRTKSYESTLKKLISKYESCGKKGYVTDYDFVLESIGDTYGTRLCLTSVKSNDCATLIAEQLKAKNMTYDDFTTLLKEATSKNDLSGLDKDVLDMIDTIKTSQSQPFVDNLCQGIESGEIKITTLNNYGNEITSYLTNQQVLQVAKSFQVAKSKGLVDWNLEIVSHQFDKSMFENLDTQSVDGSPIKTFDESCSLENVTILKPKKAVKASGYSAFQMNVKYSFEGQGEFQARGSFVDKFADREHIPYDIRKGKITTKDIKYKEVYDIIKNMSEEGFVNYNEYLTEVYNALRLKEMGVECDIPELPKNITDMSGAAISEESLKAISYDKIMKLKS